VISEDSAFGIMYFLGFWSGERGIYLELDLADRACRMMGWEAQARRFEGNTAAS
jgi:hypothetical protein